MTEEPQDKPSKPVCASCTRDEHTDCNGNVDRDHFCHCRWIQAHGVYPSRMVIEQLKAGTW